VILRVEILTHLLPDHSALRNGRAKLRDPCSQFHTKFQKVVTTATRVFLFTKTYLRKYVDY